MPVESQESMAEAVKIGAYTLSKGTFCVLSVLLLKTSTDSTRNNYNITLKNPSPPSDALQKVSNWHRLMLDPSTTAGTNLLVYSNMFYHTNPHNPQVSVHLVAFCCIYVPSALEVTLYYFVFSTYHKSVMFSFALIMLLSL